MNCFYQTFIHDRIDEHYWAGLRQGANHGLQRGRAALDTISDVVCSQVQNCARHCRWRVQQRVLWPLIHDAIVRANGCSTSSSIGACPITAQEDVSDSHALFRVLL